MKQNYSKRQERLFHCGGNEGRCRGSKWIFLQSLVLLFFIGISSAYAQQTVTGTVTEEDTGDTLPGVTVIIKGSGSGTITDGNGSFSISANAEDILVFSFVGFAQEEVLVGTQTNITVSLKQDTQELQEVVITAFGVKREKKEITYSAQNVSTEELSEARSLNVANSLSGKVAGLNFSTTGAGVGSSSRITLRGNRSLTGNNQPLYVVDGVPIDNSIQNTARADIGGTTTFDGISNLNPEDIESMSVLKGPSAAALYGTRASNGVIIITTKSGKKTRGAKVTVSSNLMISKAYDMMNLQDEYGQGAEGTYDPTSQTSWGPKMQGQSVESWQLSLNPNYNGPKTYSFTPQPDNVMDFFKTGYNWAKTISVNTGNDKFQGYFSYTNTEAEGIVTGNELDRHNATVRLTGDLSDKFKLDVKANYIQQKVENVLNTGENSVGEAVYALPRSMPYDQYKNYSYYDELGEIRQYFPKAEETGATNNPFWMARMRPRTDERNRFIGMASLSYNIIDNLNIQGRVGIDQSTDNTRQARYASKSAMGDDHGSISETQGLKKELNTDVLITYDKSFGNFSVNISAGANALYQDRTYTTVEGSLSKRNYFSLRNLRTNTVTPNVFEKKINSVYGSARIGFMNYLFLDVTGRNDWSSALPADNRSFFYPSVGLTGVFTDMFDIQSDVLTFLKARASYAQVGNDTDPYRIYQSYIYNGANAGLIAANPLKLNPNLKPEISSSLEFGLDARFFNNRIGVDITYFKTNTKDQIFTVNLPESSGYSEEVVNGGEVENKGVEVVLNGSVIENRAVTWDMTANFSTYTTEIVNIREGQDELILRAGGERFVITKLTKGGEYGDLYIKGFQKTENGKVLVGEDGLPMSTPGFDIKAGNFTPDWTAGLQNRLSYKNFSLSFLVDFRIGGEVLSYTQARTAGLGVSDRTLAGRDGFIVDGVIVNDDGTTSKNSTKVTAEEYWTKVGQRDPIGEEFIYDATNIRLREVILGYSLPSSILQSTPFSAATISLVGRNLFFIVNKAEYFDPEQGVGVGNLQGIESFNLPAVRNYGFNVKLNF
ncbi:SusC/RagA family TonB-linked outer membrane protein [Fulvivirga sediminis]|uniref:SusC/RagA family TonB-linked outer membrane protein n=1 Tax=Fulvivirga sediminis TaxID=2803949 RepID=A0A937F6G1_9BACT|nr:SusC/RagA family TonB-linked outer membrane protein [Fulvivirga sediminis]MBL3655882.1 SusC/RagA family TonB-linked outer membrane protein [Fulvivirga sediminis]